jgi:hypothetical protein
MKLRKPASTIALEMTETVAARLLTLISSLYHSGSSGRRYVTDYPEDRQGMFL